MNQAGNVLEIEDLATDGVELSDDELVEVNGGARVIVVVIKVREACTCAVGGGVDYD